MTAIQLKLLALIFVLLPPYAEAAEALSINVVADPWCPFSCESTSDKPGLIIELAQAALGEGYKIKYQQLAWSRAVPETRQGQHMALAGALVVDAPDFVFPKTHIASQESCFYVNQGSQFKFTGPASLKGKNLGLVSEYTYGEPLDSWIKKGGKDLEKFDYITGTDTALRLLQKLQSQRNEIIVDDKSVISYLLRNTEALKGFKPKLAGCLKAQPLYLAFSPANKDQSLALAKKFDEGYQRLKKEKKLQLIYDKYGLK